MRLRLVGPGGDREGKRSMRAYFQKMVWRTREIALHYCSFRRGDRSVAPTLVLLAMALGTLDSYATAQENQHHMDHNMQLDETGMVMNENTDQLPRGCPRITGEESITVRAGKEFASQGSMFSYDQHEWHFEPCTKLTVTLENTDNVRHQWMLHGLPRYVYPQGMFTIEVAGRGQRTGTFILPAGDKTYLVHCDVSQHMEKGMKAQLKVGRGDGDLPSIPGITGPRVYDSYPMIWNWRRHGALLLMGIVSMIFIGRRLHLF